jgi:uncharacterized YccA/Bax inhibitor family protein
MPQNIFEFADNPDNHDLQSSNSLHDAWLECWSITEGDLEGAIGSRIISVEAKFLGPQHDRWIYLTYAGVDEIYVRASKPNGVIRSLNFGDLLAHEMLVAAESTFSHELVFACGAILFVRFHEFTHRIIVRST